MLMCIMKQTEIKKLENSEVEITGEIPAEEFEAHRKKAIKDLGANMTVPGFRKGHIPEATLIQRIGEETILQEMADHALRKAYPAIIEEHKVDAIGRPEVTITKIAPKNPLGFKIKVAVMPTVELGDYKAIAKAGMEKKEVVEVSDKELEDTILQIRKMRAQKPAIAAEEGKDGDKEKKEEKEEDLPEFNDEFVQGLGGDIKTVAEFKEKLKENIAQEKMMKLTEKRRVEMLDEIIKGATITLPPVVVEGELDRMVAQFKDRIAQSGGAFDEYLKHVKKTEEEIRKEWRPDAEKKAKIQLVLNNIAIKENIKANKEKLDVEVARLLEEYKDADPARARVYVETVLTNEAVFAFLEGATSKPKEEKKK